MWTHLNVLWAKLLLRTVTTFCHVISKKGNKSRFLKSEKNVFFSWTLATGRDAARRAGPPASNETGSTSVGMLQQNNKLRHIIWEQAASPPIVTDPLIAAVHNRSTVFLRLRQYMIRDSSGLPHQLLQTATRSPQPFFHNTRLLPTDRQNDDRTRPNNAGASTLKRSVHLHLMHSVRVYIVSLACNATNNFRVHNTRGNK